MPKYPFQVNHYGTLDIVMGDPFNAHSTALLNKSSAIAEIAAQSCITRWRV